jgi:predicted unusual protein kinase regulating ubiquinone biosynthesis (AarF/ABC1/UbiB family)
VPVDDDAPEDTRPGPKAAPQAPKVSRFSRFAKLTGLGASVTARHVAQRVAGAFSDEATAAEREKRALNKTAEQVTKTLGELKGAAMKLGQMLSTDPELLPPELVEQLSQLQHSAPAMDFATTKAAVERALDELFAEFSEEPIGAASIGQVHRARTKDGQDVAVKVQYPGIADTIRSDMKNLGSLLVMARAAYPKERVDAYLEEITTVIEKESDYLNEADNLERFQVLLKDVRGVRVPIPVHELTRKTVLTMEFFSGRRLEDWLQQAPEEHKTAQGQRLLRAYLEMIHEHGALHADPHPGNFLVLEAELVDGIPAIGLLDLGCVRDFPVEFMDRQLKLLRGLWHHDLDEIQQIWRGMGFLDNHVDPELIYDWLCLIFEPLLVDRVTDFGAWKVNEAAMHFVLENPSIKLWAPPREVLFYVRVLAGVRALLHKVGMKVNAYQISRQVVRDRGLL